MFEYIVTWCFIVMAQAAPGSSVVIMKDCGHERRFENRDSAIAFYNKAKKELIGFPIKEGDFKIDSLLIEPQR